MFGVLNINKPAGWTSRDVVNRVQKLVRPNKVGHAGTLDPLATGVLIVCVGQATRLIQYAHRLPKSYRATFLFGRSSPTDDIEGDITLVEPAVPPTLEQIESILPAFLGTISQRPPAYSALKVQGQRAYKLARQGHDFQLAARPVVVHSLQVVSYHYPELVLDVQCGTGTYIRSLGRDLAEAVGNSAVMSALERQWIGNFHVNRSVTLDDLADGVETHLLSARSLVDALPSVGLTDEEIQRLRRGLAIAGGDRNLQPAPWQVSRISAEAVGVDQRGRVVAILRATDDGQFRPICNFAPPA